MNSHKERPHENDDLWEALYNNEVGHFVPEDVVDIIAEVPGENDEYNWWWILSLNNNSYVLLSAWCDFTGWDCQSDITTELVFQTAEECALAAPKIEKYSGRTIQAVLLGQVNGTIPFALYQKVEDKPNE